jgi:hypothetical protein
VQKSTYRSEVRSAIAAVRNQFLTLKPNDVAAALDDFDRLDALRTGLNAWFSELDSHRHVADVLPFARSS